MRSWERAWHDALYAAGGFYHQPAGPSGHFTTATHQPLGPVLAGALAALARSLGARRVVDVGCGRGELLAALAEADPSLGLLGVDVVARPKVLPAAIGWLRSPGGGGLPDELAELEGTLLVAHEWLDVVPCPVAQVDAAGLLRGVLVDGNGREKLGEPLTAADAAWAERWWPTQAPGSRVEIGRTRDAAYRDLVSRVRSGAVLAVDYGHLRSDRPAGGSLTGYRRGRVVEPVPDGSCDLTAHVAMDSLGADEVLRQPDALRELGIRPTNPPHSLARRDPAAYLQGLARASAERALLQQFGDFWWALTRVPQPTAAEGTRPADGTAD